MGAHDVNHTSGVRDKSVQNRRFCACVDDLDILLRFCSMHACAYSAPLLTGTIGCTWVALGRAHCGIAIAALSCIGGSSSALCCEPMQPAPRPTSVASRDMITWSAIARRRNEAEPRFDRRRRCRRRR